LTDDEVAVCRSFAKCTLQDTRRPAAWALAEATGRSSEIPHIRISDIDLDGDRVWIRGGSKTIPRWGELTDWGAAALDVRLRALRNSSADSLVVYQGSGSAGSRQASSCAAIADTLTRAGLGTEPDVGPSSLAAWAAARAFRGGTSIDAVARMLGVRSLDRAARIIGWDWLEAEGA